MLANIVFAQETLSWNLIHSQTKQVLPLGEKGSVQEVLIHANLLPDPFVEQNETKFDWIENHRWVVYADFFLTKEQLNQHIELDFPNLDTYATITVNDQLVGRGENAFVHYRFKVNGAVHVGKNRVKVEFTPPVMLYDKLVKATGVRLPAPNDVGKVKVAPYCRKPQYQFGWDWSLRMQTMGFWEPVSLVVYDKNSVLSHSIQTVELNPDIARINFAVDFSLHSNETYTWESNLFGSEIIKLIEGTLKRTVEVKQPKMWWPRGQGEQHLYEDTWIIKTEAGQEIARKQVKFGIKTVELLQQQDQWGKSFVVKVNGRELFCKGADYIPDDIFPARISDEKLKKQVQEMLDCNFNMVRIWGGGLYPKEAFLEACDAGGLMVWQDFMFACAMYPGDEYFLNNVKTELQQQVKRIGSHASLTLFNGNNEVDVAWKNWGFQSTYHLDQADQRLIESYYDKLFKQLIPQTVETFSSLPYEHTSPLSNWGKDEFYNSGTQHYWGVWHGKDPLEDFSKKFGRFNAEYGFQSFPEMSTIASFSKPSDWSLNSKVMKHRQKSYVGNQMIAKHSDLLFGKANGFEQFVYFSQLTQAKAVGLAISSHRVNSPRCSGTLYWQYNDCWPSISWSSVDYYGRWKALQYQVKADFEDVAILAYVDSSNRTQYMLVSDIPGGFSCKSTLTIYSTQGKELETAHCTYAILYPHAVSLFEKELAFYAGENVVLKFEWTNEQGAVQTRYFTQFVQPEPKQVKSPNVYVEQLDDANGTGVVVVETDQLLLDFWLNAKTGNLKMEQNFLTLLPGKYKLSFGFEGKLKKEDVTWQFR